MKDAPKHRIPKALADEFVASQKQGTLAAYAEGGFPRLSLLPFVKDGDLIEMHCVQMDPTFQALCLNPRVTFMVSDYLGTYPSDWVDPNDGGRGSTVFRAVSFDCIAEHHTDPAVVAAGLTRLLSVYEPGAPHGTITDGGSTGRGCASSLSSGSRLSRRRPSSRSDRRAWTRRAGGRTSRPSSGSA